MAGGLIPRGFSRSRGAVPLRRRVRLAVRRLGLDAHRYQPERDVDRRRTRFLREQDVGVVIDGGANTGQWAIDLRCAGYPGLIVSFEPVKDAFEKLDAAAAGDLRWRCVRAALGETDAAAPMHVAGNSLSSSFLDMEPAHVSAAPESAYVRLDTVQVVRLDTVVPTLAPAESILALKLDLQGTEAAALSGAAGILPRVRLIECELSLVPLYRGQKLYPEMIDLLAGLGFCLVSQSEGMIDPSSGRLMQIDAIFVRDGTGPATSG